MDIEIKGKSNNFSAYMAVPDKNNAPVVICLQEIFGVNLWMRNIANKMAELGFIAIVPDLFWRIEPNVQINGETEEDFAKAFEFYGKFDSELAVEDINESISFARNLEANKNKKVGTMGFCLGGYLAYVSSISTNSDANVGSYGVGIENKLGEKEDINGNLLLHIATEDQFVPKDIQKKIHSALNNHPKVSIFDYKADHAFARIGGESYVETMAKEAELKTVNFFNKFLR